MPKETILRILEAVRATERFRGESNIHIYPYIPADKLTNAAGRCRVPQTEEPLGILDLTVFGSAKNSIVFTTKAAYYHYDNRDFVIPYTNLPQHTFVMPEKGGDVYIGNGEHLFCISQYGARETCAIMNALKSEIGKDVV